MTKEAAATKTSRKQGLVKLHPNVTLRCSYQSEDLDGFVYAFRWVWREIPLADRRKMLRHWRKAVLEGDMGLALYMEIVPGRPVGEEDTQAVTVWEGCGILFHGPSVDEMDEFALADLIAHELAHCYQYSQGPREYESSEAQEEEADEIAARWGFDGGALLIWENFSRVIHG